MSGNEFDFGGAAGLDMTSAIADDLLDFDPLPDLTPELPVNDVGDLQAAAPVREKTEEEIVLEVEDALLDLLAQERRQDLLVLTGELPDTSSAIEDDVSEEFGSLYTQALLVNPALKWYAKLIKMLKPEQFHLDGEQLHLRISKELFKKVLAPFVSDFSAEFEEDSPIVAVVRSLARNAGELEAKESEARIEADVSRRTHGESGQFDPSKVDFDTDDGFQAFMSEADLSIEDDLFGNPQEVESELKISLLDLSNKAVAEYCDSEKWDTSEITAKLQEEGFSRAQANEIAGIVKFMRLDRSLKKRPDGNFGGDVDLGFNPGI